MATKTISSQATCKAICLKLVEDISIKTKIASEDWYAFLKILKLNLSSYKAKRFLIILSTSDSETVVDAYYTYVETMAKYNHDDTAVNVRRFSSYLLSSKRKSIDLGEEMRTTHGMYDHTESEVSASELDYCIGVMEDEDC
jgi:hypothetical protein